MSNDEIQTEVFNIIEQDEDTHNQALQIVQDSDDYAEAGEALKAEFLDIVTPGLTYEYSGREIERIDWEEVARTINDDAPLGDDDDEEDETDAAE